MKLIKIKNCVINENEFLCCRYEDNIEKLTIYFIHDGKPLVIYDVTYKDLEEVGLM